jgi:hypothetical protein
MTGKDDKCKKCGLLKMNWYKPLDGMGCKHEK